MTGGELKGEMKGEEVGTWEDLEKRKLCESKYQVGCLWEKKIPYSLCVMVYKGEGSLVW